MLLMVPVLEGNKGSSPPVWVVLRPGGAPRCSLCAHVLPSSSVSSPPSPPLPRWPPLFKYGLTRRPASRSLWMALRLPHSSSIVSPAPLSDSSSSFHSSSLSQTSALSSYVLTDKAALFTLRDHLCIPSQPRHLGGRKTHTNTDTHTHAYTHPCISFREDAQMQKHTLAHRRTNLF